MGSRAAFFASWLPKKISRSRIFIECAGLQPSRGQGPAKNLFNGSGFLIVVNPHSPDDALILARRAAIQI
jgi:hypothetical protein